LAKQIEEMGKVNSKHNPKLTHLSQHLRTEMTKEERHLWYDFLQGLPITINRQKIIGSYIADFFLHQLSSSSNLMAHNIMKILN
jgi:very-short-patch-repair endonuclease